MWETIRLVISQWGIAGLMAICIGFFVYILYVDKNKQEDKDHSRELRLNQMTDKIIDITTEIGYVVSSNTEVFRNVTNKLNEMNTGNVTDHKSLMEKLEKYADHKDIIVKLEKLEDNITTAYNRLEDKIRDIK